MLVYWRPGRLWLFDVTYTGISFHRPRPAHAPAARHIPGSAGYLAGFVQAVRWPEAQFRSNGLILRRFTLRQT